MRLIVISNPTELSNEADIMNRLFDAGLTCLHLRKPDYSVTKMKLLLDKIDAAYRPRISLHQHHALASGFNITRLHYPEAARLALRETELRRLHHQGYILSTSIHDAEAISSLPRYDYLLFGPVFDSLSKPGYKASRDRHLSLSRQKNDPEVVAIGGIIPERLQEVQAMGFQGAAVLGAIWNEPAKAVASFKKLITQLPH